MQPVSLSLLSSLLNNYPHTIDIIEFWEQIVENEKPLAIILFGSLVKREYTQYSDADIILIFENLPEDIRERFLKIYKYSKGIVQPRSYTLEEIKKLIEEGNTFIIEALEEGWILYDTGIAIILNQLVENTKQNLNLKRIKDGWIILSPKT